MMVLDGVPRFRVPTHQNQFLQSSDYTEVDCAEVECEHQFLN